MKRSLWVALLLTGAILVPAAARARSAGQERMVRPYRAKDVDNSQFLDINRIKMWVTNTGSFAWDKGSGNAGLEFPKGSTRTAVFAAGLWLGGQVGGATRVAVSEYDDEYLPGPIIGGVPAPDDSRWRVYKLNRVDTTGFGAYQANAEPYGAPDVTIQPDGTLNIFGDQMTWAVYNDANPAGHTNRAGGTPPLGVEVQQTTFAFNRAGPVGQTSAALGQTIFIHYRIINKGGNTIDNMYVSQWSDPDLGGFTDDLVGCDPSIGVGFVYNSTNSDGLYGATPPSVGYDFFQGPKLPDNTRLGMTSFNKYTNGTDPDNPSKTYNYMQGLNADGTQVVNPTTGLITTYFVSGDPVFGTGWLDTNPGDRRLMLTSGPFTFSSGDTQDVVTGIVIGDGSDRLASVSLMKFYDTVAQSAFEQNFNLASPPNAPNVNIARTDRTITLSWDRSAENYNQTPYEFEGYVVYQGFTSCGPWKRVATFDVPNAITTVLDPAFDPESRTVLPKVSALGTNSGLAYSFIANQDYIKGGPLHSGTPYYFVVTAYSVALGQVPQVLESAQPCGVTPIIPQTAAAGVDLSAAGLVSGPTYVPVNPALPHSTDSLQVTVVNPTLLINATYKVGFKPDASGNMVWYLERTVGLTVDTLLSDQTNFSGDANYAIVDGVQVKVVGAPYGTPNGALISVSYVDVGPNPPGYVGYGASLAFPFFDGSADYAFNMQFTLAGLSSMLDPSIPTQFTGAEIRLTGVAAGQKAYRYVESATVPRTYPYTDYVDVPFTAWDTDANRQINVGLFEWAGADPPEPDATWNPDDPSIDPFAKREWIYLFKSSYSGTTPDPLYTTTYPNARYDSGNLDFQYVLWAAQALDANSAPIPADVGDKIVFTRGIRSENDAFTFTTRPATAFSASLAKSELNRVLVVPNPYFAHSRYEQTQFDRAVKFTHLPARCTIRIFNLGGDLVRTMEKNDGTSSQLSWDLLTDHGLPVGSGIYVFHVQAPGVGEKVGKMAVFLEKERLTNY